MASTRGQGGIQQLLAAEQEAQHIVNAARNAKTHPNQMHACNLHKVLQGKKETKRRKEIMQASLIRHSLLLSFFLLLLLRRIHAQTPKRNAKVPALIAFGDSIVDPGNNDVLKTLVKCDFPPYGQNFDEQRPTGRFSNGKIPGDMIAESLGIKDLLPAYFDPNLTPEDLLTGVSFASGGCGYDDLTSKIVSVFLLSDQLKFFSEYKEKLKAIAGEETAASIVSDSIYLVIIGTDDIANTYYSTPFRKTHYDVPSYAELMVQSASSFYQELYQLGARKIVVVSLPPLGCVPAQRTLAGGLARDCAETHNQAAITVNKRLSQEIDRLNSQLEDARLIYADIYTVLNDMIRRPTAYGFEVSDRGCCGTGNIEVSVLCNRLTAETCQDVSKYVFWDSYHPTEKAYRVIVKSVVDNYLRRLL